MKQIIDNIYKKVSKVGISNNDILYIILIFIVT